MTKTSRGLSGICIFEDGKPVCLEECRSDTRRAWMETNNKEYLMNTIERLCDVINDIGGQFNLTRQ